jgi:hypothetical protein
MQQNFQQNQKQKKFGTVSFIENKVRINYSDGTDSVLFEDIASISYRTVKTPNLLFYLLSVLGFFLLVSDSISDLIAYILIFLGGVLPWVFPNKFDNVIIETRGGKLLIYSVELGLGKEQMELIEMEKRKHIH